MCVCAQDAGLLTELTGAGAALQPSALPNSLLTSTTSEDIGRFLKLLDLPLQLS